LARSRSRIMLSFDAWSSPNYLSMLGVVAHWIDANRELKTGQLALKIVKGHHGVDMAAVIKEVVTTYGIRDKVGAF
jgi:hypothetical protein